MKPHVRVGGEWLHQYHDIGGVKHSTIFRREGWSGDYQASVNFAAPASFEAAWFAEGARFDVVLGGKVLWSGEVSEKTPSGDGWSVHAFGTGAQAANFTALVDSAGDLISSTDPQDVVDRAISAGWAVHVVDALPTDPVSSLDDQVRDVAALLNTAIQNQGQRWSVDCERGLRLLDEPTSPTWILSPGDAYLGTVDDEYVTTLHAFYVATLDADGKPDTFATVTATDAAAVAKFGTVRERTVDLTGMGLLAEAVAQAIVEDRLRLVGGRTGWTNTVTLTDLNVRHISGAWAQRDMVRAGEMLRVPGVMDSRSSATTRGSIDIVLAEVEHDVDAGTSTAVPLGFVPRDFSGALAAAPENQRRHEQGVEAA